MGLFIQTIGIGCARIKIGLANLVYNMERLIWLENRGDTKGRAGSCSSPSNRRSHVLQGPSKPRSPQGGKSRCLAYLQVRLCRRRRLRQQARLRPDRA